MKLIIFLPIFLYALTANSTVLECSISSNPIKQCATSTTTGNIKILKKIFKEIKFNKDGLAEFSIKNQGCYWLNRKGETRKTHCFDNGSDYFVEGLARYIAPNGKFGFINKNLKIVIPAKFDFAFPFEGNQAKFCQGCKSVQQGEHSSMTGGIWGVIDKKGNIVKP